MDSQPSIEDRFKAVVTEDSQEQPEETIEQEPQVVEETAEPDVLDIDSDESESEEVLDDQTDDEEEELEIEESAETEIDLEATYIIDGVELKGQEIKEGYLRQSDYTRKTQEVSELRKAVEAEQSQAKQNLELGVTALGMLTSEIDAKLQRYAGANWTEIAAQADPKEYNRMQAEVQSLQQRKQQLSMQAQHLFQTHNAQAEAMKAEQAQKAVTQLKANIPNWNNNTYSELQRYGVEIGFSEDEMLNAVDARLFTLLHKAKQADSAATVATKKRVKASPKRAMQSGSVKEVSRAEKEKASMSRLKSTGRVDDAAEAFKIRLRKG